MNKTRVAVRTWLLLALMLFAPLAWGLACDVNNDGVIDLTDINLITAARNQNASGPNDPRDADGDGRITVTDVRICSLRCTRASCSTQNMAPTANAGPDQTLAVGANVILDGSGSHDPEGDALTYAWTFTQRPPGSAATLDVTDPVHPRFVVDQHGNYTIRLVVTDSHAAASAADSVQISTTNSRPIANAGSAQTVLVTQTVTLDGHLSSDADGDPLTYSWTFAQRAPGSAAALNVTDPVHPTFVVDKPGSYTLQLIVNDGFVDSLPASVIVTTQNSAPVARAGPNQTHFVGETAVLDGSGSSDVDGDPLTYAWSITGKPSGSAATLSNPGLVNPSFLVDKAGTYVVQLIVNDGHVNSAASTVSISTINSAPVANAGPDQAGTVGQLVQLNGAGSSDVDGDPLTFAWSLTRPAGSSAALSATNTVNPTFTIDVPGTYVAQLIVNDGLVSSAPDMVQISTGNQPPVANPGVDQTVPLGATVHLDASLSSDPEHQPLTYAWSLQSKPQGSTAALSSTTSVTPTFVADKAGQYVVQLIVNDGSLNSVAASVRIDTANSRPVANAGPPQTVNAGAGVQLDGSASFDPDGAQVVLGYNWSFTTFPGATAPSFVPNASAVNPSFVTTQAGSYVAQLIVSDGLLSSAPATVTITANNTAPVAGDDSYTTAQDTLLTVGAPGVLGNDSDAQHDALTAALVGNVTHGTLAFNGDGGFTYMPTAGYNGPDSFTYRASDGSLNSNIATVAIAVSPAAAADIRVTKTVDNATPNVGANVTFTVTTSNLGPAVASNIAVQDLLPAGYTFVSKSLSGATGAYNETTGAWTIPALTVNQSATLQVTATALGTGPYLNTATKTASTPSDPNTANDSAFATTTPAAGADIAVSITIDNPTPTIGQTVQFIVRALNNGPGAATGVVVQDLLPSGYTFVSKNVLNGTYDETTGVWNVGNLALNQTGTLIVNATLKPTGLYNNTATRTASAPADQNPANDTFTLVVTPLVGADIAMSITIDNPTPTIGQTVQFIVRALNNGPGAATGVVVQDLLPSGYTFVSKNVFNGTYDETTGVWTVGNLALNQTGALVINATVRPTGLYNNTATRTASTPADPDPTNDTFTLVVTPFVGADIAMSITIDNPTPTIGQTVQFIVRALNNGPGAASGVVVQDLLPSGYTFVSKNAFNGTYDETTGVWTVGNLALNQTGTLVINATVRPTGLYNNTATRTASTPVDQNPANDTFTLVVTPFIGADIAMSITIDNPTPTVGQPVQFIVRALNNGPGAATGVVVQELLPSGYTFVSKNAFNGTYDETTGVWSVGNLSLNQTGTLVINATVRPTGLYNTTATRTASTPADPNPANDAFTLAVTPFTTADIAMSITIDNPTPTVGQPVQFIVRALNNGPGAAAGVVVQDLLPSGYTFVSKNAFNGTYDETTGVWSVGNLSLNQTGTLVINATVRPTGLYNNTATRTASTPADPSPDDDTFTLFITPFTTADIALSMTVDNATPAIGQPVQFVVRATNGGPGAALGVVVQDLLPSGYTFVSKNAFNGTYDETTGVWAAGNLAANQTATLVISATVKATGSYSNVATRTASSPGDPNNTNDSATVLVTPH